MYVAARKHFASPGPTLTMRIAYTLPPLVFASIKLAVQLKDSPDISKKAFQFVHETISGLGKADNPELSFKLFVNAALASSTCKFEEIAYEFVTQAFVMYEENITDSKLQFSCLQFIIGAIHQMDCFSSENYETIITKTAQHSSRLLVKPNKCRAIYTVSHLFWTPSVCIFIYLFIFKIWFSFIHYFKVSRRKTSFRMFTTCIKNCRYMHGNRNQFIC